MCLQGRVSSDTYLAPQYDPTKTPRIEGVSFGLKFWLFWDVLACDLVLLDLDVKGGVRFFEFGVWGWFYEWELS